LFDSVALFDGSAFGGVADGLAKFARVKMLKTSARNSRLRWPARANRFDARRSAWKNPGPWSAPRFHVSPRARRWRRESRGIQEEQPATLDEWTDAGHQVGPAELPPPGVLMAARHRVLRVDSGPFAERRERDTFRTL
jgi:hypothetical protein